MPETLTIPPGVVRRRKQVTDEQIRDAWCRGLSYREMAGELGIRPASILERTHPMLDRGELPQRIAIAGERLTAESLARRIHAELRSSPGTWGHWRVLNLADAREDAEAITAIVFAAFGLNPSNERTADHG